MSIYIRILFSLTIGGLVLLSGFSLRPVPLQCGVLILLLLTYLCMIWLRQDLWTHTRYVLLTALLLALVGILRLSYGINLYYGYLMIPLVLLLAKEQQQEYRRFAALLAAITVLALFAICYPSTFVFQVLAYTIVLYICIRAINIYKEATRLSQQHVQELAQAHHELQHLYEALQEASLHSLRYTVLAERTRLARDMHDGLGHQLTALIVQLQALELMLPADPPQAARTVPAMLEIARQAMAEIRLAVREWSEDERGLGLTALRSLASQWAAHALLTLEFRQDDDLSDWPVETSATLYRILQEALTNVVRHADATAVTVEVQEDQQKVTMTVSDNGTYTDAAGFVLGFGTRGMRERAQAAGGSCSFLQRRPHGMQVRISLPLEPAPSSERLASLLPGTRGACL
ncbi:sensor histidine kinase [Ktedonosporobacter rubrisoli]|uniref:histidine kinase n=1 Tax=Ktedonosporobacter rubrisoli TaxID=2509675 RepID=A0A4P6JYG3_KTERU|nr:sensor histidine kinase [Ktedonosporobacter rubrisoli]QBD80767.1 sensor histidine kinase [Ktedonosporobacter rubrisoli]